MLLDFEKHWKKKLLTPLTAGFEMELDSVLLLIAPRLSHAPLRTTHHVPGHGAGRGAQSTNHPPLTLTLAETKFT